MFSSRFSLAVVLAAASLVCVGCGHGHIRPSSSAKVIPGAPGAAVAESAGIRISADGEDWNGRPTDLDERLIPLKVRIVNHSGRPIEILYERFALTGHQGRTYQPLPPVSIDHDQPEDSRSVVQPIYAAERFFVARRYKDVYPSLPPWGRPIARNTQFSERQYKRWPEDLPTREMKRLGLPEGVLADGGAISGYLFFEDATRHEAKLTFKAALEDGQSSVADIEIPFRVE